MRPFTRTGLTLATIAGLTLALASPVHASEAAVPADVDVPSTLAAIQAAGDRATTARISAINRATPSISRSECVGDDHQAAALAGLESALGGMESLRSSLAAATTVDEAADLYRAIFEDWRVYAVVVPQAHYAVAADCLETVTIPALLDAQTRLEEALAGEYADAVTPEIEADMAELQEQLDLAQAEVAGAADAALAVTASDYNADAAVLTDIRLSISAASSAARLARIAAGDVAEALR
jgi:hypothetical protein